MYSVPERSVTRIALCFFTALSLHSQSAELARQSQQAKQLMAEGRFAEAVPIYEKLSSALPANTGLRLNLGLAYQMSGHHKESVPQFERVLQNDPNNIPALLSLGAADLELGDPSKAVPPLQKMVALQPSHVPARGMLANALLATGRPEQAASQFRKLAELTPEDPKSWFGLGRSYEASAQQAFEQINRTAQGSPEWLVLVADSRMERRQYRSAFYFYRQALEKQPGISGVHSALADLYRRTEHPEWSETERKRESALPPPNCSRDKQACDLAAGKLLAAAAGPSLYWRTRAFNELALRAFQQLGKLPPSAELYSLKAEILANHGQHLEAAQEWSSALRLSPGDIRLEGQLATSLYEAADYPRAIPMLETLLKANPQSAEFNFFLGDALLRSEQPDKAILWLENALKLNAALLPAHASLGLAYARLGRDRDAVAHLDAARSIDEDGSIHFQLARVYDRLADAEKSQRMMGAYREILGRAESGQRAVEEKSQITAP